MRGLHAVLFATLVMLIMPLSGCVGSNVAKWGTGSGEITVSVDDDRVSINSRLTGSQHSMSVNKTSCFDDQKKEPFVVEGWLSQYHHYIQSADESGDDDDLLKAVTTVIIVEIMDFSTALEQSAPNAKRVDVKDFGDPATGEKANPLSPRTLGEPKLDKDTAYLTLGLIPASENILFGLNALDWHTPVRIEGYFLTKDNDSLVGNAFASTSKLPDSIACRLTKGPGGEVLLATKVQIGEDTIISMNGESDDEWVNGDVPILGRWAYTISLMAIGGGGAFGMFILSTAMQRRSAAAAASMLLGKERVSKAKGIKKEIKEAREDGLEISKTKRKKDSVGSSAPKAKEEDIKGFSLDNVLGAGPSISGSTMEMGGGSVLVTDEAIDMDEKLEDMQIPSSGLVDSIIGGAQPASRGPPGGGAQRQSSPPTRAASSPPARESPPPRERTPPRSQEQARSRGPPKRQQRAASQPPQQESPPPRQRRPSMADDDDFSDFSF